jgi:hypothetical protein
MIRTALYFCNSPECTVFQDSTGYKSTVQQELSLLRKLVALRRTASTKAFIAARTARGKLRRDVLPTLPPSLPSSRTAAGS